MRRTGVASPGHRANGPAWHGVREWWRRALEQPLKFPLTIKHYYSFDGFTSGLRDAQLSSSESWDVLRTHHPHFLIPEDRDAWINGFREDKDGHTETTILRAREIADLLLLRGIVDVHSTGAGGAMLEYYLKTHAPNIRLTVSDYSLTAVSRLRNVFTECERVVLFDMLHGDWTAVQPHPAAALVLMHRVDPSFTNDQWRTIFEDMARAGVQNVLFVPDYLLSVLELVRMQVRFWKARLRGLPISFVGYDRTPAVFERIWHGLYFSEEISVEWQTAYWLRKM